LKKNILLALKRIFLIRKKFKSKNKKGKMYQVQINVFTEAAMIPLDINRTIDLH
jgi:hypothetical protein